MFKDEVEKYLSKFIEDQDRKDIPFNFSTVRAKTFFFNDFKETPVLVSFRVKLSF